MDHEQAQLALLGGRATANLMALEQFFAVRAFGHSEWRLVWATERAVPRPYQFTL